MPVTSTGYAVGKQPIAQSFFVAEPAGIYCTKFDLYFKTKDAAAPVSIEVRPMINGFPSSSQVLPGSVKSKVASDVNISADATTVTEFILDEPLYLRGLQDYALVVTADSKDYEIYVAQINEFVVGSTEKRVNKQPTLGSLFYSQNGVTFTPAQNQDLTFRMHRAKFTNATATAKFTNAPIPLQLLENNPITTDSGSNVVTVFHPHHGMQVGQGVTLSGVDSLGVGGISAATLNKKYNITSLDYTGYKFTADSSATANIRGGGAAVKATKNISFSTLFANMQTLTPPGTEIAPTIRTTASKSYADSSDPSFQKDTNFRSIKLLENEMFSSLRMVANDSAEINQIDPVGVQTKSLDIEIAMAHDSNIAPMIDLHRSSVALISNVIDKQASSARTGFNVPLNFVSETSPNAGSSASKHLSKQIVLEEEAVGLKILIDANKPSTTDFEVYVRTCEIDESLTEKEFTLVPAETTLPSDENNTIFRQYTFLHGGLGGDLIAFKKYQTKIVMRSTNQAFTPMLRNLRVIALSV